MKILVIGGGGREHAVIKKLRENPRISKIYAMPGNGGIEGEARCLPGKPSDIKAALAYIRDYGIDFAVVSPDDPLVQGMADSIRASGIPAFGPSAKAARIEGSKVFSKRLMAKYNIPTASCEVFDDLDPALDYISLQKHYPVVIKADGLALGKGVYIAENEDEAGKALRRIMEERIFGESGNRVVVEEFLEGPEVTVLAFTDSKTIVPLPSSMDHKRAGDGDSGPNTGGMGVIAPNPCYTEETAELCMKTIFLPTIDAMNREGSPFRGCLYFGLMLTGEGPKVIEYNCRFGDPEAQALLPFLETDLLSIMQAVEEERLAEIEVRCRSGASCCLVLASGGYPEAYRTGFPLTGLENVSQKNTWIFHAGTALKDGIVSAGGRVLGITVFAGDLKAAVDGAYREAEKIRFEGMYYRKDIGKKAMEWLYTESM
ncbi:MAG: phosphoribosylamine--glycine ligase [Treponema sp.]|jgi:phosphoribosylamine--glycine ligase|nr:phosphoribosylamine--glycine ligase [Treponema sp.]